MRQESESKGKPRGRPFVKGDPRAGRKPGVPNKTTREIREIAQSIVDDPEYRENLEDRLRSGKAHPSVECLMWHYAYGKPREQTSSADGTDLAEIMALALGPRH